jgi:NADH-quinone oxidoreductase subunit J
MDSILSFIGNHMFHLFGLLALVGAVATIASKNAVHSVVGFLIAMLSISACYLCLSAEFLAVAQLLVYAGGIVVLFLFVVMLVEMTKYKEKGLFQVQTPYAIVAVALGAVAFLGIFWRTWFGPSASVPLRLSGDLAEGLNVGAQNAQAVSRGIFADYLLPFEILSVILLVALVAAVVLAKTERV